LLNRVSGELRSVVHDVAGTTVDPVDSLVELDGEVWRFVDSAGVTQWRRLGPGLSAGIADPIQHGHHLMTQRRHGVARKPVETATGRGQGDAR
ncbi:GTPase, partial [Pseudonocardia acidicola]|uniref:GTPase n=1 Tax=Pseudonocardia acidicola TaxID=2724939 RepID=UPI001EF06BE1